jgi:type IV pilus assembly protein PilM
MRRRHSFFEFFPPPELLSPPAFGFDMSDRSIRFAQLKRTGHHLELARFGEKILPVGSVVKGEIKDEEAVRNSIHEIVREQDVRFAHISLPEQLSYVITLTLPKMPGRQMRESILLQLSEHIPFDPSKVVFDYILSPCANGDRNKVAVSIIAAHEDTVTQYCSLYTSAKVTLLSMETESHSLRRALFAEKEELCKTRMVLDIGATKTALFIENDGLIQLTSTIPLGGNAITEALAKADGISFEEARKRKEEYGIGLPRANLANEAISSNTAAAALPVLALLANEIKKHYLYWNTQNPSVDGGKVSPIEEIVISGGEIGNPGFIESLARIFGKPFVVANPWLNIATTEEYVPEIPRLKAYGYAVALGLALRSFWQ